MKLSTWMEKNDIDSTRGLAVSLATIGFSPAKGRVLGMSFAPLWEKEVQTVLARGCLQEDVTKAAPFTGITYDDYLAKAIAPEAAAAKVQDIAEDAHWVVVYNFYNFFQRWLYEEMVYPLETFPILEINSYVNYREAGKEPGAGAFTTIFELQETIHKELTATKDKKTANMYSFPSMCSRYIPSNILADTAEKLPIVAANALNLKMLTQQALDL